MIILYSIKKYRSEVGDINNNISKSCLSRLPKYLRILKEQKQENFENISATIIANELNLNSIQVRKDLALVSSIEGKPGIGFNINKLIIDLENFLGMNLSNNAIIVGAGKLGQALLEYTGFGNNLNIVKAFDNDNKKCNDKNICNINKMADYIKNENIRIGIITVPSNAAQEVCNIMIKSGIKAIWNFAPVNLKTPENIAIKNEDLSSSFLILLNDLNKKQ